MISTSAHSCIGISLLLTKDGTISTCYSIAANLAERMGQGAHGLATPSGAGMRLSVPL
jgi:hypothetical protein